MRSDLPPVKPAPTGKQVRMAGVDHNGNPINIYVSNEVNGKLHFESECKEFWITVEEYNDGNAKIGGTNES